MSLRALIFVLFLMPTIAFGAPRTFELERGKVEIEVPGDWQDVRNLFGIPLMLLGPEKAGGRPVVQVTATGHEQVSFDQKGIASNEKAYRQGREEWIHSKGGKALSFVPLKLEKWGKLQVVSAGFRYELAAVPYVENTYYVNCGSKLFHLKTLLRAGHESDYRSQVDKMVRSFACK